MPLSRISIPYGWSYFFLVYSWQARGSKVKVSLSRNPWGCGMECLSPPGEVNFKGTNQYCSSIRFKKINQMSGRFNRHFWVSDFLVACGGSNESHEEFLSITSLSSSKAREHAHSKCNHRHLPSTIRSAHGLRETTSTPSFKRCPRACHMRTDKPKIANIEALRISLFVRPNEDLNTNKGHILSTECIKE